MKIHIKIPTRTANLLCLLLLGCIVLIGLLAWGGRGALAGGDAPAAGTTGMRKYYLTVSLFDGEEADLACATGYHMASLWEILDTSNLEYDTDFGVLPPDGGPGPNSEYQGWVRTGYLGSASSVPGEANCQAWTSYAGTDWGTIAGLDHPWSPGIDRWVLEVRYCDSQRLVWCVED